MTILFWIVGIVVVAFIVLQAVAWNRGRTMPLPVLGRDYLRQALQRAGVENRVPLACVIEIADTYAMLIEAMRLERGLATRHLVRCLNYASRFIVAWVVEGRQIEEGTMMDDEEATPDLPPAFFLLPEILQKHGVARGGRPLEP